MTHQLISEEFAKKLKDAELLELKCLLCNYSLKYYVDINSFHITIKSMQQHLKREHNKVIKA